MVLVFSRMSASATNRPLPRHVAVIGAAGGLGQGILEICREENISFTAVVRSRPERITNLQSGSSVAVVPSLSDCDLLSNAFRGADAVISAVGVTSSSNDKSALLSANMKNVVSSMKTAGVDRIVLINTILSAAPGQPSSWSMRLFSFMPGNVGKGARELRAVVDAVGNGELSGLRWTLVRAGVNSRGKDECPAASEEFDKEMNSLAPVSYRAMGRWMLEESVSNEFVCAAPAVSRRKH
jgi:nucleoside-diphosphate-sugar epimerase